MFRMSVWEQKKYATERKASEKKMASSLSLEPTQTSPPRSAERCWNQAEENDPVGQYVPRDTTVWWIPVIETGEDVEQP
jgi:hypothetical protein